MGITVARVSISLFRAKSAYPEILNLFLFNLTSSEEPDE